MRKIKLTSAAAGKVENEPTNDRHKGQHTNHDASNGTTIQLADIIIVKVPVNRGADDHGGATVQHGGSRSLRVGVQVGVESTRVDCTIEAPVEVVRTVNGRGGDDVGHGHHRGGRQGVQERRQAQLAACNVVLHGDRANAVRGEAHSTSDGGLQSGDTDRAGSECSRIDAGQTLPTESDGHKKREN